MNHKCTACGKLFEKDSNEILSGCTCGSKRFYFVKAQAPQKNKKTIQESEMQYFYELEDDENNEIVVFDLEAVNIKCPGKYEVDINSLLNNNGVVYRYAEGKYSIDLEENLKVRKKR